MSIQLALVSRSFQNNNSLTTGSSSALVSSDMVASMAMERLNLLRMEMETTFARSSNEKSLQMLAEYEKKVSTALQFVRTGLSNQTLSKYKERLIDEKTMQHMKSLVEKGGSAEKVVEETFKAQIAQVNRTFPDELEAYAREVGAQLNSALDTKKKACEEQSKYYLSKLSSFETFLNKSSSVIPEYSIYGTTLRSVAQQEEELKKKKTELMRQIEGLVDPEGLLKEIREKIKEIQKKMDQNLERSLIQLRQEVGKQLTQMVSNQKTAKATDQASGMVMLLKEMNTIYLGQINQYLDLVTQSVNELIAGVQGSAIVLLSIQDMRLLECTKKSQALSDFLDYQTKKILEIAKAQQKPVCSQMIGGSSGNPFDDKEEIARGRISQINIRSGWIIDAVQAVYEDAKGGIASGTLHGGGGGGFHTISLPMNERIQKVVLCTGAFKGLPEHTIQQDTVDELTFHTNLGRVFGPYGGRGDSQGKSVLEKHHRIPQMKMHEITYGPEYYLGGIRGNSSKYINSLSFVFFKDFSPLVSRDLSGRMSAVLELCAKEPACRLSEAEQKEIHSSLAQMSFIDLSGSKNPRAVLGVLPNDDVTAIKKAYHKLCLQYHPDKVPKDKSYQLPLFKLKLEEVQAAYKALVLDATTVG
ncbi:MAG TPA: DnaJ domain-containing protein [Chlamydiales bacterium]|nr:DnaJ domain-containing protein [Chlamydiales bacterium]